jgi:type II pantothenate kinase
LEPLGTERASGVVPGAAPGGGSGVGRGAGADVGPSVVVGVDWGATLAKLAVRRPGVPVAYRLLPVADPGRCRRALEELGAVRAGLTGAGAAGLARALPGAPVVVNEFAAWGSGAAALLGEQGERTEGRYLVVSVGTGTSVLLVDGLAVTRVGGTALGGGTLLGLATRLVGTGEFARVTALAREGTRQPVDLLVSDLYEAGGIPLAADLTASSFGKLARPERGAAPSDADLACALVGLVGENVALVCAGLAAAANVTRIVFGGSTLRENPTLVETLGVITRALGREPVFLRQGEFAGALGALLLASPPSSCAGPTSGET